MTVKKHIEERAQYIYIRNGRIQIAAARALIATDRFSPWLITHGKEHLPQNAIARGKYLTKIFNQH